MHFLRALVLVLTLAQCSLPLPVEGTEASKLLLPRDLKCEYARDPGGVDVPEPRLFWKLESQEPGQKQTAYQVLVASSAESLGRDKSDRWNSGKTRSEESIHIRYAGRKLQSSEQVFWKVRVWDKDGKVSEWSKPASWTMGVLSPQDWKA
jgi:alpha-L-rhamnosidase